MTAVHVAAKVVDPIAALVTAFAFLVWNFLVADLADAGMRKPGPTHTQVTTKPPEFSCVPRI
jgi:hypothetical protein